MPSAVETELIYLRGQQIEYKLTLQVLAIMVERLLQITPGDVIIIPETDLANPPDLLVERRPELRQLRFRVER